MLSTETEHVKLFEITLTGGFSYVNTCLAFDSEILLPKDKANDYKLTFDLKNKQYKKKNKDKNFKDG